MTAEAHSILRVARFTPEAATSIVPRAFQSERSVPDDVVTDDGSAPEGSPRDLFSDEEWGLLKHLPFQAFLTVASADGEVDVKEVRTLATQMERASLLIDPLHRELMQELAGENHAKYLSRVSTAELVRTSEIVRPLLRSRLSEEQYRGFIRSLFVASLKVAKASGGGFLGLRNRVSRGEAAVLATFANLYEVEVEFLMSPG